MNELITLLEENCPGIDFRGSDALIDDGILDSLDLVTIVSALMDAYDITITVDELLPENFNSVEAIYALVERLKG